MTIKNSICLFILMLSIISCSDSREKKTEANEPPKVSRYDALKDLFKDVDQDTLYVYSTWELDDKNFQYKGLKLDSIQVQNLNYDNRKSFSAVNEIAACGKFELGQGFKALIVRSPGEYSSTVIELLIFDAAKDSVIKNIYLADVFGDAGESFVMSSCIFKDKGMGRLALSYYTSSYDHSVNGEPNDSLVETSRRYVLFDLSKNIGDTLSKDSAFITGKYNRIVKKLEGE